MIHDNATNPDGDVDLDALQRIDPRLVALALGRIDDDELDELLERAMDEPEVRRAVEAFWPLDETAREESFERARALVASSPVSRRPHWFLLFLPSGLAVSAVASAAFVVLGALQGPPLPSYQLEVSGGLRVTRSSRNRLTVGRFAPSAPLDLVFRPAEPVLGPARASIFRVGSDGFVRLDVDPEVSGSGSVRWHGTINSLLPGELGPVELVMAVQAGQSAPNVDAVRRALIGEQPASVRVAKTILVIEEQ